MSEYDFKVSDMVAFKNGGSLFTQILEKNHTIKHALLR